MEPFSSQKELGIGGNLALAYLATRGGTGTPGNTHTPQAIDIFHSQQQRRRVLQRRGCWWKAVSSQHEIEMACLAMPAVLFQYTKTLQHALTYAGKTCTISKTSWEAKHDSCCFKSKAAAHHAATQHTRSLNKKE
jgi:hypothetical protein